MTRYYAVRREWGCAMASPLWAKCLPVAPCNLGHRSAQLRQGSAQVGGDMEGARVQHISVGLQHVAALAVSTQMRQLPGRVQVCLPGSGPMGLLGGEVSSVCPSASWSAPGGNHGHQGGCGSVNHVYMLVGVSCPGCLHPDAPAPRPCAGESARFRPGGIRALKLCNRVPARQPTQMRLPPGPVQP